MKQIANLRTIQIVAGLLLLVSCTPQETPAPTDAPPLVGAESQAWDRPLLCPPRQANLAAVANPPRSAARDEPTDLGVQLNASVAADQTAMFTLTVANHGPALAANVTLTDRLPPGASLAWFSPRRAACNLGEPETPGVLHCDVGDLQGGDSVTVTLDARAGLELSVQSPAPSCAPTQNGDALACRLGDLESGTSVQVQFAATVYAPLTRTITNTVVVAASNPDLDQSNNAAVAAFSIAPAQALVEGEENVDTDLAVWSAAPARVVAGRPFTYTLTVVNNGPMDASGVTLHDILPPGILVHATSPGRPDCALVQNGITCLLDDAQDEQDIEFTFLILSDVTTSPDIALDPLDPGWPLCEVEAEGDLSRAVHCYLGDLRSGQKARVTLLATAGGVTTRAITNTVSVRALENDADLQNNAHRSSSSVELESDLSVIVIVDERAQTPGPAVSGQALTYTLGITNHGPSDARYVLLTSTLPSDVSALSATDSTGGACTLEGDAVYCRLRQLPGGQSASVSLVVQVNAQPGQNITHTVLVAAPAPDPHPGNNQARTILQVTTTNE